MAEGFKKYFNGTTINGRANVAKATYATLALLYIVYRMRKGGSKQQSQLASGKCNCESDTAPHSDPGIYEVDPDCSVCRERSEKAMTEYDKEQQRRSAQEDDDGCRDDPPPPPSGGQPRRKCPCEEPSRRVEGSVKHSSHHITGNSSSTSNSTIHGSSSKARGHQFQTPYQYQQRYSQTSAAGQAEAEQVRPASALVGQVHDAVYRVFRGVVGAMFGGSTTSAGSGDKAEGQSPGSAGLTSDPSATSQSSTVLDEQEDEEDRDEGLDYDDSEETPLKRRTAPRSCVPTNHDMPGVVGLEDGHYLYQQQPEESPYSASARNQAHFGSESSKSHQNENDYSGFTDGFASGLFFGDEDQ